MMTNDQRSTLWNSLQLNYARRYTIISWYNEVLCLYTAYGESKTQETLLTMRIVCPNRRYQLKEAPSGLTNMNQYATAIYQGWSTFKQACLT